MIVELSELKAHLRVETDEEDDVMESLLLQAQAAACDYCHTDFTEEDEPPEPVRLAVLLMASHFYENRDNSDHAAYTTMINAFHALLYPYRDAEGMF